MYNEFQFSEELELAIGEFAPQPAVKDVKDRKTLSDLTYEKVFWAGKIENPMVSALAMSGSPVQCLQAVFLRFCTCINIPIFSILHAFSVLYMMHVLNSPQFSIFFDFISIKFMIRIQ